MCRGKIKIFDDDSFGTCSTCGLAKPDLCICVDFAKTETRIKVILEKRKWNKVYTVLKGFDAKELDLKDMAVKLKSKLACGGTVKGDVIELQGNHEYRVLEILEEMGFDTGTIDIIRK